MEREELVYVCVDIVSCVSRRSWRLQVALGDDFLQCYLVVLGKSVLTLGDETFAGFTVFIDVKNEKLEDEFERFNQIIEVETKFINEEWLNYLVIKQYALRKSLGILLIRTQYWELHLERLVHLVILHLKGAHDIASSNYEIHHTGHQHALAVLLALFAYSYHINEVQKREEFLVALFVPFEELQ